MFNEKTFEAAQDIFKEVGKHLNRVGFYVILEELQSRYDDALHKIILDEEREKNCRYISGELRKGVMSFEIAEPNRNVSV